MNTHSAYEYTMLVSAALLYKWQLQQHSSQNDDDLSVIRKVGRAHQMRGAAPDLISVPQYITVVWGSILMVHLYLHRKVFTSTDVIPT
jgi:hypothetical protein